MPPPSPRRWVSASVTETPTPTARLELREMTDADLPALRDIMTDPVAMTAYEGAFDEAGVVDWLRRQQERYARDGFGLWAICLRETGEMVGQCGITRQAIEEDDVIEVGYLFRRRVLASRVRRRGGIRVPRLGIRDPRRRGRVREGAQHEHPLHERRHSPRHDRPTWLHDALPRGGHAALRVRHFAGGVGVAPRLKITDLKVQREGKTRVI